MAEQLEAYTYRNGKRFPLRKKPNQFVVRALADELKSTGLPDGETMSSASTRVTCKAGDLEKLMNKARKVAPTHHAYESAETGAEFLITDRVLVTFKQAPSAGETAEFAGEYGLIQLEKFADREYLFQVTGHTGVNPVKLVVKLTEQDDRIECAENDLNYRMARRQFSLPEDPHYLRQWHLHTHSDHPDVDHRSSSKCEEAWRLLDGFGSRDVVVCVSDDGCRLDHPDFDSPGKFADWGYFRNTRLITRNRADADPDRMYQSGANHGTSCAGVIAGEVDGVLTVGAAPGCRLLPIKWESQGPSLLISDSKMMTALNFIADKVDVMSNSWGIVPHSVWSQQIVDRIAELSRTGGRRRRGIVFAWAAGNDNSPIEHTSDIDVPFTSGWQLIGNSWHWVGVQTSKSFRNNLTDLPGVLHVAALASTARRSHYSNYGTGIDICAPTNNVHAYHRLEVEGLGITTTTGEAGEVRHSFGGTSSATPLAAGIAALVISANPQLSAAGVISVLRRTASKDLSLADYLKTPPASFDPDPIWDVSPIPPFESGDFQDMGDGDGSWSPWFGFGKVDAEVAVARTVEERGGSGDRTAFESSPNAAIPDNNPDGIADVIEVGTEGRIVSVRISVDISHSWIGDLRVRLIAPDGTAVLLHDRSGANGKDIRQIYDSSSTPALTALSGRRSDGIWALAVEDLAQSDEGTLNRWGLDLSLSSPPVVLVDAESVTIPDASAEGVTRSVTVERDMVIADIAVSVDITHSWAGDLSIALTPPDGDPVRLQHREGGSADNIRRTWRTADVAALASLLGHSVRGDWQLNVADLASEDIGKLNSWSLELVG